VGAETGHGKADVTQLPDPRAWVGRAPFPWPPASSLDAGDALIGCYAVVSVQVLKTRQDKPYLKVQLTDSHGPLEARVWDDADSIAHALTAGSYVGVRGRIEIFNNERQLKVETIEPIRVELEDLRHFLPRSKRSVEAMEAELTALLDSIADPVLRQLLDLLLGPETETGRAYRLAPAAKRNHHASIGGLLEHSLSVATLCSMLAAHYGDALDRDLVVAGALLHDLGKIREIGAQPGFPYTDEGRLLGHILIGLQIVHDAAASVPDLTPKRLLLLEHLVASHQGRFEWQSPREPRILEGLVLHYADDLDAKMQQVTNLIDATPTGWTAWDRSLQRDFLRHLPEAPAAPAPPDPVQPPAAPPRADRTAMQSAPARPIASATPSPPPAPHAAPAVPFAVATMPAEPPPAYAGEPEPDEPDPAEFDGDVLHLLQEPRPNAAKPVRQPAGKSTAAPAPSEREPPARGGTDACAGDATRDPAPDDTATTLRLTDESLDLFGN
jgi:3'-5' exoribonuclease